jgi:hypothetical protein
MFKIRTSLLFGVVFILAIALATTAYFKMTAPASSPVVSASNPVTGSAVLAPISANAGVSYGAAMSDESLRHLIDRATDHRWGAYGQTLLSLLNGRYEHRCCGLPR